jgi:hypothetical protein
LLRHARSRQISAKRNHIALMAHRKLGLHRGDRLAQDVPTGWYIEPKATRAPVAHKVVPSVPKTWHSLGAKLIVYEGSND